LTEEQNVFVVQLLLEFWVNFCKRTFATL